MHAMKLITSVTFFATISVISLLTSARADEKPVKPYPLKTCIVSGEDLGTMGKPVVIVHEGQEVKFCCKNCKPRFEKDPAKYLSKLTAK